MEFVPSQQHSWEKIWESSNREKYSCNKLRSRLAATKIELLLRKGVHFSSNEDILESGCGDASFVLRLAETFSINASGIDFSVEALSKAMANAASKGLNLNCAQADARCTPYPDGRFDKVISLGIVEHFKSEKVAISENFRILKPKGQMILMTPNKRSVGVWDRKLQNHMGSWPFGYQTEYSPVELCQLSESAGFITQAAFGSHRPICSKDKLNMQAIGIIDRLMGAVRPENGFYSWYIGCKP